VQAESAVVGLADRLFTQIMSQERVPMGHSSLMINLTGSWLSLEAKHSQPLAACIHVDIPRLLTCAQSANGSNDCGAKQRYIKCFKD